MRNQVKCFAIPKTTGVEWSAAIETIRRSHIEDQHIIGYNLETHLFDPMATILKQWANYRRTLGQKFPDAMDSKDLLHNQFHIVTEIKR